MTWVFFCFLMVTMISLMGYMNYSQNASPITDTSEKSIKGDSTYIWMYMSIFTWIGFWFIFVDRKDQLLTAMSTSFPEHGLKSMQGTSAFKFNILYNILLFAFGTATLFVACYLSKDILIFVLSAIAFVQMLLHLFVGTRPFHDDYRSVSDYQTGSKYIVRRDISMCMVTYVVLTALLINFVTQASITKTYVEALISLLIPLAFVAYWQVRMPMPKYTEFSAIITAVVAFSSVFTLMYKPS